MPRHLGLATRKVPLLCQWLDCRCCLPPTCSLPQPASSMVHLLLFFFSSSSYSSSFTNSSFFILHYSSSFFFFPFPNRMILWYILTCHVSLHQNVLDLDYLKLKTLLQPKFQITNMRSNYSDQLFQIKQYENCPLEPKPT